MRREALSPTARASLLAELGTVLQERPEIVFAYVHGSVLQTSGFRDVDVAVWAAAGAPRNLDLDLAAHLSAKTGFPVDVRLVNDAPGSFLFHVLRGVPLVVHDERLLADLIERVAREYHDLAPLRLRAMREAYVA